MDIASRWRRIEPEVLFRRSVVATTAVGAAWRVAILVTKWNVQLKLNDSFYYSLQAYFNARGKWFREAGGSSIEFWGKLPGAEHPPLTSLLLTPASLLAHHVFWQRATMTLIGICVVPLIALLGRRVGGRRVGLIAAILAAVYPNIWMSDALVMSESSVLALVAVALLLALRHRDRFDLRSAALLGLVVGVAAHARSELLLYGVLFAFIGFRSHPVRAWAGRAAVMLLATVVTVLPWIVYNSSRFSTTVLMSTNEGNTWLGANCDLSYGGEGIGGWSLVCLDDGPARPGEDSAARSDRRRQEAIDYMRSHAKRVPVVVVARLLRAADLVRIADTIRGDVGEERPAWGAWAGVVCWWLLAPMSAIGLLRLRRGLRYVLSVPIVGVLAVTVVFYGSHRLRAPMEPVVVVGAAVLLASLGPIRRLADRVVGSAAPVTT